MKKIGKMVTVVFLLIVITTIILIGYYIYRAPYREAEKRNRYEDQWINGYLMEKSKEEQKESMKEEEIEDSFSVDYQFSDVNSYNFHGQIDGILVIDKINLKKAIIRGNIMEDNDYNLSKYYFVTSDLTTTLDGNYIIYGHSSQTYGHSFNRLDELAVHDTFYFIQDGIRYNYQVEAVDRALRSESRPYFPDYEKQITLVSCEKYLQKGYKEKRVIIVRAVQIGKEIYEE